MHHIYNTSIRFLRQAFILAAVSGFHMEQRDVKALRRDRGEAGISIAENKVSVRLQFGQQFIGPTEDVPASDTKVLTYTGTRISGPISPLALYSSKSSQNTVLGFGSQFWL